jgi:competence protein ComEC
LKLSLKLIDVFAGFEYAAVKTFTPTVVEIGCYYVLFWAVLSLIGRHHTSADGNAPSESASATVSAPVRKKHVFRKTHTLPSRFIGFVVDTIRVLKVQKALFNQRKFIATLVVVVTFVLICDAGYWLYYRLWHPELRITIMDVGQGNAALLELPDGYTILIDGGGFSDNSIFDIGARVVAPFLWRKKIKTIDTLVLTHPNSDHLNGLIYIAEHFKVQYMWTNGEAKDTLGYRTLMQVIAKRGILLPNFDQLPRRQIVHGVEIDILYPPDNFLEKKGVEKWRNSNNNSVVIRVSLGSISFLFPGDIMAEAEKELAKISQAKLASTVLLAPHHGSRSSGTALFLDRVAPQVVAISSGRKNSFKFPHTAVLQQYRRRGSQIFRTDTSGAITFITDGENLLVIPFVGDDIK